MIAFRRLTLILLLSFASLSVAHDAAAESKDPCNRSRSEFGCFGEKGGTVDIGLTKSRRPTAPKAGGAIVLDPLTQSCLDALNEAARFGLAVPPNIQALCGGTTPVITAGMVVRAFRELPLYRGAIRTDPGAWTLVNLDTYFWCGDDTGRSCAELGQSEQTVTLLGRQVRVRPRIVSYTWSFGDGTTRTETGGDGRTTHVYRSKTTAAVVLTLTWTADYSVGGGPFQPVAGTTTTTGPPRAFPVREARPVLVGGG